MQWNERDLEDWAEDELAQYIHPRAVCVGRQVTLPSGRRADLVFMHHTPLGIYLTIAELKAVKIDTGAVVQTLDYVRELSRHGVDGVHVRGLLVGDSFSGEARLLIGEIPSLGMVDVFVRVAIDVQHAPMPVEEDVEYDESVGHWGSEPYFQTVPPDERYTMHFESRAWARFDDGVQARVEEFARRYLDGLVRSTPRHLALVKYVG